MRTEDTVGRCLEELEIDLAELPKEEVRLSSRARARIRAEVMAHARGGRRSWWHHITEPLVGALSPARLAPAMVRPLAVGLSLAASLSLAGSGTVFAAMESLPGDGLYPVKTVYEQTRLALSLTEEDRAQTYMWIASTRVDDLARAAASGRLDAVPKVAESYGVSLAQALTLAASSKEPAKVQQQAEAVQTSMVEVYKKAPEPVKEMVAIALSMAITPSGTGAALQTPAPPASSPIVQPPPDRPSAFIEEAIDPPAVSGQQPPTGSTVPANKGQVAPEPTPVKDGPISSLPVTPVSSEPLPVKNDVGPATAPLPTRDGAPTMPAEPEKADAPAPAPLPSDDKAESTPTATSPGTDSAIPTKESSPVSPLPPPTQKDSIVVQGSMVPLSEKQ